MINWLKESIKKVRPLHYLLRRIRRYYSGYGSEYRKLRKRLEKKDKASVRKEPRLGTLHLKLNKLRKKQVYNWDSKVYCDGYFYQGYEKIGINGIKPTEKRIKNYEILKYFDKNKTMLDIGSNAGFLSCYLSEYVHQIDAIEVNPYLIQMAKETQKFLDIGNVNFIEGNFISHDFKGKKYDIVFSLSNHFTIDGNLNLDFESYMKSIFQILNKDGICFFESHNIERGDKDLDAKFKIASKYFNLVNSKMVTAFYKPDIDKLFAIFKRQNNIGEIQNFDFRLEEAKNRYSYA